MLQQALDNPGNTRYVVNATVIEVGNVEYSQTSGKPFQRIQLNDGQMQRQVKIFPGKGQPLTQQHVGRKEQFSISSYVSTFDNNVYLSGFWQAQDQQQTPPQAPPPAAQRPNSPNKQNDARNTFIERQATFRAACHRFAGMAGIDDETITSRFVIDLARAGHYFIETGNNIFDIPTPDKEITSSDNANRSTLPSGDEIPF